MDRVIWEKWACVACSLYSWYGVEPFGCTETTSHVPGQRAYFAEKYLVFSRKSTRSQPCAILHDFWHSKG
uniref:Uncharacterized protein n=1 Tax=Picea sitchensis TaxID=3332 RepID=A9NS54_PICSI|nr:unknown [Picea sitchensis]